MARTSVGLDIGTRAVRVVEVRGSGHQRSITRFGRVLLPAGAVDHGEVVDPRAVTEAVETLWKRLRLTTKTVHLGLANRRVVVRVVDMPDMSREDLEAAIKLQAQDHIPIPLSEAVMDYEVLEDVMGAEGQRMHRVLVVAAERSCVDPLIEAVQAAKLEPSTLELNAYALVRSLGNGSGRAEAIVDIGAGVTNVVIARDGQIQFTRILPNFGGDDFTNAVAEGLGVPFEQAEAIKRREAGDLAKRVRGAALE
ncbi:MAG: type IV pilus assembly protein PilM, partial [Candidatus Binatia bacterium]